MATTTTNFSWPIPQSTDLVKDGATAIASLGSGIDTSLVDLKGGTTGQVLSKASNTDMDFTWVAQDDSNAIQNAIVDAKGDLISATAADTPARLAVGTNGQVLMADSTAATGLKWGSVSSAVVQVVSATNSTAVSTTGTTYVDSNLSATITPTSSSNKILVLVSTPALTYYGGNSAIGYTRLLRGSTFITGDVANLGLNQGSGTETDCRIQQTMVYLDSPATTSATTYKMQFRSDGGSRSVTLQVGNNIGSIILMEVTP